MKLKLPVLAVFLFVVVTLFSQNLEKRLDKLTKKYPLTYETIKVDSFFTEKYVLYIDQPVDHNNPGGEHFKQRVFLSHLDYSAPVVFITEGYAANYAARPKYVNELSTILDGNQICVEHRYFGTSVPKPLDWAYLTVENAAKDHHRVIEILKRLYDGKWVSTGISKGGQTAIYHRYFYPDDVDISVPYVAPLNFSIEEQRVYRFLDKVGNEACRKKILDFQAELMQHKKDYIGAFENLAKEQKLTYRMGIEKAYDLIVFEFSFAFWQWGFNCEDIPSKPLKAVEMIQYLDEVAGIDWISDEGIKPMEPFFYQAMREIGFYGYNIEAFKNWTSYTENPTFEFTLPEGVSVIYEPQLMRQVDYFVRHEAEKMLFIYGGFDPWSAPAVELTYHTSSVKVVKPGGSHLTRVHNLPEDQKQFVMRQLQEWLAED